MAVKKDWIQSAKPGRRFNHLSRKEQAEFVARDGRYGRVVCRCEMITEGEIVAEIHSPIPAQTYDAIKRRTWLGTGRCLGSFDIAAGGRPAVTRIGIPVTEVTKRDPGPNSSPSNQRSGALR